MDDPLVVLAEAPQSVADGDKPRSRIQVAVIGDNFRDPRYGRFKISQSDFDAWRRNLGELPGGHAMVDLDHESERGGSTRAAGWITGLDQKGKSGEEDTPNALWATVEWTKQGAEAIRDGAFRFFSPTYGNYKHEDGRVTKNVLSSGALTNKPFLRKGMAALSLSQALPEDIDREEDEPLSLDDCVDEALTSLSAKDVGPEARDKLKGLIKHYMGKPHPFTACVRDNEKRFGPDRVERVCAVLKDIGTGTTKWRNGGDKKATLGALQTLVDEADVTLLCENLEHFAQVSDSRPPMDELLKNLGQALSLDGDDLTEDKVLEKVKELSAEPAETDDKKSLEQRAADDGKVVLSQESFDALTDEVKSLKESRADDEFASHWDKAVRELRVPAKDESRETYKALWTADPENCKKLLDAQPKIANAQAQGQRGEDKDVPDGVVEESFKLDQRVKARMADKDENYVTALSAVQAEIESEDA